MFKKRQFPNKRQNFRHDHYEKGTLVSRAVYLVALGWLTPFIVVFIAYTFVAFEAIADEIEEPFGTELNDLSLKARCHMIENILLEMTG